MNTYFKRGFLTIVVAFVMFGALLAYDTKVYAANTTKTATESSGASVDQLMLASELVLNQNFGNDYTISREGDLITMNVWADGIAAGAAGVAAGVVEKKDWTDMTDNMAKFSATAYKLFEAHDVNVNVNVLNDLNKKNTLVSYLNGVNIYDVVEE